MFDDTHSLDLTDKEMDLIQAALHTQKKILSVQSKAGGSLAKARLNDLTQLLGRLKRQTPAPCASKYSDGPLGRMAKSLFCI
ncbi:MAG: hypothetical protein WBC93_09805 [Sulfitobacter sp.]